MNNSKFFIMLMTLSLMAGIIMLAGCGSDSGDKDQPEQTATVPYPDRDIPELDTFFEIFKMVWHANMDGDLKAARDSAQIIITAGENLAAVQLPEFYDDVRADFESKLPSLTEALTAYGEAAAQDNDSVLSAALDDVRKSFVDIMVSVSVQIPEVENFHEVLQPLWHRAMPDGDYDAIKAAVPQLKERAGLIVNAELPEKYSFLKPVFDNRAQGLMTAVDQLATACEDGAPELIEEKMTAMHDAYRELSECLD